MLIYTVPQKWRYYYKETGGTLYRATCSITQNMYLVKILRHSNQEFWTSRFYSSEPVVISIENSGKSTRDPLYHGSWIPIYNNARLAKGKLLEDFKSIYPEYFI